MPDHLIPLDVLEAADKAATPAKDWQYDHWTSGGSQLQIGDRDVLIAKPTDAELIVLYREWGPRMVQALRELRGLALSTADAFGAPGALSPSLKADLALAHAVLRVTGGQS